MLLHFGAVDQWCRVAVNGQVVGEHLGGYLPFTLDVTDALRDGENELRVVVRDPSDTGHLSRGKQRLARGGIWYTPQSGIWQTVWVEAVPAALDRSVEIVPDLGSEAATPGAETLRVLSMWHRIEAAAGDIAPHRTVEVVVRADGVELARATGAAGEPSCWPCPAPRRWSPEDPFLYDLEVRAGPTRCAATPGSVRSGSGRMRRGSRACCSTGSRTSMPACSTRATGPTGGYTAPSDEALVHDIATMKRLGFTMLRKHIKIEPLRWYHHCDRLGMLVWQDMVNGGSTYNPAVISVPAVASRLRVDDSGTGPSPALTRRVGDTGWPRWRHHRLVGQLVSWRCGCRSTRAGASSTPPPCASRSAR